MDLVTKAEKGGLSNKMKSMRRMMGGCKVLLVDGVEPDWPESDPCSLAVRPRTEDLTSQA